MMMRTTALDLLTAVEGHLVRVIADAAYDTLAVYETARARGATVVIRCLHRSLLIRQPVSEPTASSASTARLRQIHVGWTVTDTCTTATKIRRVRPPAVKMSRNTKRWLTRPACIAGVLVSRPNLNARCGRMKL